MKRISFDHPIFHCFFDLSDKELLEPIEYLKVYNVLPDYRGLFDDDGRLMVLINYNTDVGDGWELPEEEAIHDFSVVSYKLGINYLVYAYTH